MEIVYFLIPITIFVMIIAAAVFIWAVKSGQFDDLEGPAYRILMDDDDPRIPGAAGDRTGHDSPATAKSITMDVSARGGKSQGE